MTCFEFLSIYITANSIERVLVTKYYKNIALACWVYLLYIVTVCTFMHTYLHDQHCRFHPPAEKQS